MDKCLERIIQELKSQGKNQGDLTQFLGVSHTTFGNWKSERNQSYKKYIHAIADFLGVSVEYLRGDTDIKEKSPVIDEGLMAANTVRIAGRDGSYVEKRLSDDQVDLLRRMIDQLPDYTD